MAPHLDYVVLFAGEGKFLLLVETIKRKGIRATMTSTRHSARPMLADELKHPADSFLNLQDIAPVLLRGRQSDRQGAKKSDRARRRQIHSAGSPGLP